MSSFFDYNLFQCNHVENKQTLPIIKQCFITRYHDIGCECLNCRKCREEIIDFYKKKKKQKKTVIPKSSMYTVSKPIPIPIPTVKKKIDQDDYYLIPNSLPQNLNYKTRTINSKECILCSSKSGLSLINDFYFLCDKCNQPLYPQSI